jgi:hypothetical protein
MYGTWGHPMDVEPAPLVVSLPTKLSAVFVACTAPE